MKKDDKGRTIESGDIVTVVTSDEKEFAGEVLSADYWGQKAVGILSWSGAIRVTSTTSKNSMAGMSLRSSKRARRIKAMKWYVIEDIFNGTKYVGINDESYFGAGEIISTHNSDDEAEAAARAYAKAHNLPLFEDICVVGDVIHMLKTCCTRI